MQKQKKAIVASVLASVTMLTITSAASTQNISAYIEAKNMLINSVGNVTFGGDNYNSATNYKVTDENGNILKANSDTDIRFVNGDSYQRTTILEDGEIIFDTEFYNYLEDDYKLSVKDKIAFYEIYEYPTQKTEDTYIPSQHENLSDSRKRFVSVCIDTIVPNDTKSLFYKSEDGTITVDMNKNQIPELLAVWSEMKLENIINLELKSILTQLNQPELEKVTMEIKGNGQELKYVALNYLIAGTDESGNEVSRTISRDYTELVSLSESLEQPSLVQPSLEQPDLTGYTVVDKNAKFEGTATFIKDGKIYEVISYDPYNTKYEAYYTAGEMAGVEDFYSPEIFKYFDTVTFPDGKVAYIQK